MSDPNSKTQAAENRDSFDLFDFFDRKSVIDGSMLGCAHLTANTFDVVLTVIWNASFT